MIHRLHIDAFAATPETRAALEQVKADREFAKSRFNIHDGGLDSAARHYSENPTPPMVIVEETGSDQEMMDHLASLAEVCEPGTKVVVIGDLNDIRVYRTLISQGVSEYLYAPVAARDIAEAILGIFADPTAAPKGRMIAFYGAHGGVGSSTLAHNVAWNLTRIFEDEVILIDLDLAYGTAALAFNAESRQTVNDALAQPERIDAVLLERSLAKHDDQLQILPSAADIRLVPEVDVEALDRMLDLTRQMASFVVLDLPHLWTPWVEHALRYADEMVIVALPDLANLRDCKMLLEGVAAKRGDAPTRLVLNRVDAYKKTQLSAKDFEENLNIAPTLSVSFEPNLFGGAANNGQMIGEMAKTHKIAEGLKQLAVQLAGRQAAGKKKQSNLLTWLRSGGKGKKSA